MDKNKKEFFKRFVDSGNNSNWDRWRNQDPHVIWDFIVQQKKSVANEYYKYLRIMISRSDRNNKDEYESAIKWIIEDIENKYLKSEKEGE